MAPRQAMIDQNDSCTEHLYDAHRKRVWGLAYRLTGSSDDADDIVQETFVRLLERPPPDPSAVDAWLVRVATHLGIDAVRRRRRQPYQGTWLPVPVECEDEGWQAAFASDDPDPETRYELVESVTFAFLVAIEALGPRQRAALLLRDVFGFSAAHTAAILETSEGNARILHLRARRAMQEYDRTRCVFTPELRMRHREAIERLLACLAAQDVDALESLLAESVRTDTDAGGVYTALAEPMTGRSRVARFYVRAAAARATGSPSATIQTVNGLPAVLISIGTPVRRQAPRTVMFLDLTETGEIRAVYTVLAPRKLSHVTFGSSGDRLRPD